MAKTGEVGGDWLLIDAAGLVLGRLASKIAMILMGKHRPEFTKHIDTGDFVVVINADKVKLTGAKETDKDYQTYSKYMGGQKRFSAAQMRVKHPEKMLELAVKGMLPKGPLGAHLHTKLKVYAGTAHPHQAQQPKEFKIS